MDHQAFAERLGREVARLRRGEEQPPEERRRLGGEVLKQVVPDKQD